MTQIFYQTLSKTGPFWAKWAVQDFIIITPDFFYFQPNTADFYHRLVGKFFGFIYHDFLSDNLNMDFSVPLLMPPKELISNFPHYLL